MNAQERAVQDALLAVRAEMHQGLNGCVVWRFDDAPREFQKLYERGDAEWIVLVPKSKLEDEKEVSWFLGFNMFKHPELELPNGDRLYCGGLA